MPLRWLRSYVDPDLDAAGIGERLDLTGTELERIERLGVGGREGFVVGKVLAAGPHPDADRLRVCTVDDGSSGDPRTIVCGAPNVAAGQTVAVARPGAVMPDGTKLGEAELRGIRSNGMILAEDELGMGPDHGGILELAADLAAGSPLADALPIDDDVLELEITPNRPDCLSVYGIAREVHAATGAPLAADPTDEDVPASGSDRAEEHVAIEIADPEICLRFTGRVFEGVEVGPSPPWLRQRLTAAGQRPISNVVDITNYVMLATGQPLHSFDLDQVRGDRIAVRKARPGERMVTLDDIERQLHPEMALVCDAEGPSGIAGVMGGRISEVSAHTTRVLMEAATWVGPNILATSKALGLRSEASTRFEKQLHPGNAIAAQRLAARLMVELCGARMVPGTIDVYPSPTGPRVIELRSVRVARILGAAIPEEKMVSILESLGFAVERRDAALAVSVPYWRDADVQREADLLEEIARIHGLDRLPVTLPARRHAVGRLTHRQRLRRRLEDALRDRGLHEIVAWSFTAPEVLERLRLGDPDGDRLALSNPVSEDQSVMRPLLLPGLLDAARDNAARGAGALALFESAHVYRSTGGLDAPQGSTGGALPADERHHLGGLLTQAAPATWRRPAVPGDFYAAKGLVEALATAAGAGLEVVRATRPYLNPGRSAAIVAGGEEIGWIGDIHPSVVRAWDLDSAAAFELDFDALARLAPEVEAFADVTGFPAVWQDIAVVAPGEVEAAAIGTAAREGGGDLLVGAQVFDVYEGEQVGKGNRSLALRLEFRAPDRTLTEAEVNERREAIEVRLAELGGRLRG
ncbi:MAG: phenylalanine--tRNA ligase subunit beta [Thermoleophilaceae bacterium]